MYYKAFRFIMPIKRSLLESKWYYRTAKTLLLLVPLFLVLYAFGMGFINFNWLFSADVLKTIAANNVLVGEVVGALIVYYVVLAIVSHIFFYLVFGGIEDDRPKAQPQVTPTPVQQATRNASSGDAVTQYIEAREKRTGEMILWIIFLLAVLFVAFYGNQHSTFIPPTPNPLVKCVPTGCGTSWYCAGTYYDNGIQKSVRGCYSDRTRATSLPSWSGTCRKCPS